MLIRRAQMNVLHARAEDSAFEQAVAFVKSEMAQDIQGLSDEVLRRRVRWSMDRARELGLEGGIGLQAFLALTFGVGPYFDRHPAIKRILSDTTRAPAERMAAIFNDLSDRTWEEMGILAGADDWNDDARSTRGAS